MADTPKHVLLERAEARRKTCREASKRTRDARRAAGLCTQCGRAPAADARTRCEDCLEDAVERVARTMARKAGKPVPLLQTPRATTAEELAAQQALHELKVSRRGLRARFAREALAAFDYHDPVTFREWLTGVAAALARAPGPRP